MPAPKATTTPFLLATDGPLDPQIVAGLKELSAVAGDMHSTARLLREAGHNEQAIWAEARAMRLDAAYNRLAYGSPIHPRDRAASSGVPIKSDLVKVLPPNGEIMP